MIDPDQWVPGTDVPRDLETAQRWLDRVRREYRRERDYTQQLELKVAQQAAVVDMARAWHKSRGKHRRPALECLKTAVKEFEKKLTP